MELKFKGETAYALLCPCCDENILCGIDDVSADECEEHIRVLIYPTHKDADEAINALMSDERNVGNEAAKKRPEIIMVKIIPINYEITGTTNQNTDSGTAL